MYCETECGINSDVCHGLEHLLYLVFKTVGSSIFLPFSDPSLTSVFSFGVDEYNYYLLL